MCLGSGFLGEMVFVLCWFHTHGELPSPAGQDGKREAVVVRYEVFTPG